MKLEIKKEIEIMKDLNLNYNPQKKWISVESLNKRITKILNQNIENVPVKEVLSVIVLELKKLEREIERK